MTTMAEVKALAQMAGIVVEQPTKWRIVFKATGQPYDAFLDTLAVLRLKKSNKKRRWRVDADWASAYSHRPLPYTSDAGVAAMHMLQLVIAYLDAS